MIIPKGVQYKKKSLLYEKEEMEVYPFQSLGGQAYICITCYNIMCLLTQCLHREWRQAGARCRLCPGQPRRVNPLHKTRGQGTPQGTALLPRSLAMCEPRSGGAAGTHYLCTVTLENGSFAWKNKNINLWFQFATVVRPSFVMFCSVVRLIIDVVLIARYCFS